MAPKKVGVDRKAIKRVTCKNCGSILEYFPKDVKIKSYSCMGELDTYSCITCPECKASVTVKS